jgi:uncharacterized protein YdhG (YjbR/CyaY superfamily)
MKPDIAARARRIRPPGADASDGRLVYFAAFTNHIGSSPPVQEDATLERAVAPSANDKGNLRVPLDKPMPCVLIARIVKFRVKENAKRAAGGRRAAK